MTEVEILNFLQRVVDGQHIRVFLASGRMFDGIYNGAETSLQTGLYFDTMDDQALRAEWSSVESISYASARAAVGDRFVVPPEHPLSGAGPVGTTPEGLPRRAHTTRNH